MLEFHRIYYIRTLGLEQSLTPDSDPFTQTVGEWVETWSCGGTGSTGLASPAAEAHQHDSSLLGWQYSRQLVCDSDWSYQAERLLAGSGHGLTPQYLAALRPIGVLRSVARAAVAAAETCLGWCSDPPALSVSVEADSGTRTLDGPLHYKTDGLHREDTRLLFLDPLPTGDLKLVQAVSKVVHDNISSPTFV